MDATVNVRFRVEYGILKETSINHVWKQVDFDESAKFSTFPEALDWLGQQGFILVGKQSSQVFTHYVFMRMTKVSLS